MSEALYGNKLKYLTSLGVYCLGEWADHLWTMLFWVVGYPILHMLKSLDFSPPHLHFHALQMIPKFLEGLKSIKRRNLQNAYINIPFMYFHKFKVQLQQFYKSMSYKCLFDKNCSMFFWFSGIINHSFQGRFESDWCRGS